MRAPVPATSIIRFRLSMISPGQSERLCDTPTTLADWEKRFALSIGGVECADGKVRAALLPVLPDRGKWEEFLTCVRADWKNWKGQLLEHPCCLMILYCGLAFFEYDEHTFWPQFAKVVGSDGLPVNQQTDINGAFAEAAGQFRLPVKRRDHGTDFVGSALNQIGVPLSLWDGFLDICEWALWRKDWQSLSNEDWAEAIEKRSGSRKRLRHFLIENRESASAFIQEMLDAREILSHDLTLTIKDIAQASVLRPEYFDDVPETADFLRPQDPDSLFRYRVRLILDESRRMISLFLPSVSRDKLPAYWCVGSRRQQAAPSPDELVLNSDAFSNSLQVTLEIGTQQESQRIRGVDEWGLFDTENGGRFMNLSRDHLPLKSYVLASRSEVELLSRDGFDDSENEVNERFEFTDGTACFLTRLWPTGKHAQLSVRTNCQSPRTIRFKTRAKVEARFISGWGAKAAYFNRTPDGRIKTDHLPIPCVTIPIGYFKDNATELDREFKVFIDGKAAAGRWNKVNLSETTERDDYRWDWNPIPWLETRPGVTKLTNLSQLKEAFKSPDLRGGRTFSIEARPHISENVAFWIVERGKEEINRCWQKMPGAFLPMFLLCQSVDGMRWEDLVLAKDVIAPESRLSPYTLHKYERLGYTVLRGRLWFIRENRAESINLQDGLFELNYCGDPSILWGLYRRMICDIPGASLPIIQVSDKRGEVPYLKMTWPARSKMEIEKYLRNNSVKAGEPLWSH
jgi:hypothetical protein